MEPAGIRNPLITTSFSYTLNTNVIFESYLVVFLLHNNHSLHYFCISHLDVPQMAGSILWDSICTALMYFILAMAASVSSPRGPMVSQISLYRSSVLSGLVAR